MLEVGSPKGYKFTNTWVTNHDLFVCTILTIINNDKMVIIVIMTPWTRSHIVI